MEQPNYLLSHHVNTMPRNLPRHIRAREHTASMIAHFMIEAGFGGGYRPITPAFRAPRGPRVPFILRRRQEPFLSRVFRSGRQPFPPLEHPDPMMQIVYECIYEDYSDQNLIDEYWHRCTAQTGDTANLRREIEEITNDFASNRESNEVLQRPRPVTCPRPVSCLDRDAALARLPRTTLIKGMVHTDGEPACSICMGTVEFGNEVLQLQCEHWFHSDCIVTWLKRSQTCPFCREVVGLSAVH